MKARTIISVILSLIAMVLVPALTITTLLGGDALGIMLILTFTLNPIVSVVIGILSGWDGKVQWYLPLANAVIFLIASILIMEFDISLLIEAVIYFALGILAAYITNTVKNKKSA